MKIWCSNHSSSGPFDVMRHLGEMGPTAARLYLKFQKRATIHRMFGTSIPAIVLQAIRIIRGKHVQ